MEKFVYSSEFFIPKEKLFSFHEEPIGFETLVTGSPGIEVLQKPKSLQVGEQAILKVPLVPVLWKVKWIAEHKAYEKNSLFEDWQIQGPFREFRHKHIFRDSPKGSILLDEISFDFFLLPISKYFIKIALGAMFQRRHSLTAKALGVGFERVKS